MSDDVLTFTEGTTPLLVSVPHDGRVMPPDITARMTAKGRAAPDTDWHVARLYDFVTDLGASVVTAQYSRYVVDLNRPPGDDPLYPGSATTGLCPEITFAGDAVYEDGHGVPARERQARVARYWRPYHQRIASTLAALRERHGYALLWDAHSIVSRAPRLFDGELPVLNLGTFGGRSCASPIETALTEVVSSADYSSVVNGRFTGGYITRHYGDPANHVHAVQLELAQRSYMDETTLRYDADRAARLAAVLRRLLETYRETARAHYG